MSHVLPDGWRWVQLGQFLEPVSRPEDIEPDVMYHLGGVRWYAAGVHVHDVLMGHKIKTLFLNRVMSGDVTYNKMWASKGAFGVVHDEHQGIHVTNEYPLFAADATKIDVRFLEFCFQLRKFWQDAKDMSRGTTERARLNPDDFLGLEILCPPLDEQRRIAAVLRDADASITRVEEAIRAAQEVKRGVMRRVFTYGMGGEDTPTQHTPIGEIPEGGRLRASKALFKSHPGSR